MKYLNKGEEPVFNGIEIEVISVGEVVTARLTNITDEYLMYGTMYAIQVFIDGEWYDVPPKETVVFPLAGFDLFAGESVEKTYGYSRYGDLPKGTYRLIAEGAAAEFEF